MIEKSVHIAIIDDGVNEEICDINLNYNVLINDNLEVLPCRINVGKKSHGTICASIIKKYCNSENIVISSVKILGERETSTVEKLCKALEWCSCHEIDVVNISLGSIYFVDYEPIRLKINSIYKKGIIMICAASNRGYMTYPASLSNVIGVKCDKQDRILEPAIYSSDSCLDGIDFVAFSRHELIDKNGEKFRCKNFNSFAAPMVTAKVVNILSESYKYFKLSSFNIEIIKYKLRNVNLYNIYSNPDWINCADIFYIDEARVYDIPYYFKVNHEKILKDEKCLCDEVKRSMYQDIDTIIIYSKFLISEKVIEDVCNILNKKNISLIFADDINIKYNYENLLDSKKWYPASFRFDNKFKCEEELDVPVIVIHGDEENLILKMLYKWKKEFQRDGYNAYICVNKVKGIFYACDYIKEFSNVKSYIYKMIELKRSDICIVGNINSNKKVLKSSIIEINHDVDIYFKVSHTNIYKFKIKIGGISKVIKNNKLDLVIKEVFYYINKKLTN